MTTEGAETAEVQRDGHPTIGIPNQLCESRTVNEPVALRRGSTPSVLFFIINN